MADLDKAGEIVRNTKVYLDESSDSAKTMALLDQDQLPEAYYRTSTGGFVQVQRMDERRLARARADLEEQNNIRRQQGLGVPVITQGMVYAEAVRQIEVFNQANTEQREEQVQLGKHMLMDRAEMLISNPEFVKKWRARTNELLAEPNAGSMGLADRLAEAGAEIAMAEFGEDIGGFYDMSDDVMRQTLRVYFERRYKLRGMRGVGK